MNIEARPAHKPALAHLFWWFMFAQGGVIAAVLIPVHIPQAIFYGGAVLVTLITIWVLLTTAPMSVG